MRGLLRVVWPLFCVIAVAGYLVRAALPAPELSRTVTGFLFLLLAVILAALVNASRMRLNAFIKGARGEESVAGKLSFLPSTFTVFHGLPSMGRGMLAEGGRDLDHVVVGPSGLFVIETKNWDGKITTEDGLILYNGEEPGRQPVEQVKAAASRLRSRLKDASDIDVDVHPVVCFVNNSLQGGQQGITGVVVCNSEELNNVLTEIFDSPLDDEKQNRISSALKEWIQGNKNA